MKSLVAIIVSLALCLAISAAEVQVIPKPFSAVSGHGVFTISPATRVQITDNKALALARIVAKLGKTPLGIGTGPAEENTIAICADSTDPEVIALGDEGYRFTVTPKQILIEASALKGAFYGVQTFQQLLSADHRQSIPCVIITDRPRFGWRGLMLDASRHFQNVDTVKRLIDLMAMHKLNTLHWHLVDSHGWRIEIKKYPRLTSVGGFREQPPIGRYGGYYTQDDIRDIVTYAADRFITVVPEIEMPGHSTETTASYPHLACQENGKKVSAFYDYPCLAQRFPTASGSDVLCAGKDTTFGFLEDVLSEVMGLFPSPYIHVGGDEVQKKFWAACPDCQKRKKDLDLKNDHELQSYFMKRVERFLNDKGRRMIGWDEILEGGLAPNAAVMSWRGEKGGIASAQMGHDVVMSPEKPLYFDHGQSNHSSHPNHWPGRETLEEVYHYNPIPKVLTADQAKHILGCQANVWTCFIHTDEILDCQIWPRACALAETAWSPQQNKEYAGFLKRLDVHKKRLDKLNVSYWNDPAGGETLTVSQALNTWKKPRVCPALVTTTPVTQNRDKAIYDWTARATQIVERNRTVKPDVICIGDSITHYWAGEPKAPLSWGQPAWDFLFTGKAVTNMGFGWDRTENVLYRLQHGALEGIGPELAILLIGTNNLSVNNTPREIYWGIQAIVDELHARSPKTKVLLLGILPRTGQESYLVERVNNLTATLNDRPYVRFYNVNYALLDEDGLLNKRLYKDSVHVNGKGYQAMADALKPVIESMHK